ncbi:MAG: xanthine dehydrogenase accessory protein XdhC [Planctomycetes bacterium]|nr:xanthine dehydrogenase accessory protein XdhC [Planctomycetota bacterium]
MDENRLILRTAAELAEAGEEFVLITVIRTQGSTPRGAGAKMIWRPRKASPESDTLPNGSTGTVGGGQFEDLVLQAAEKCVQRRTSSTERLVLGAEAEQCCGGVMEVFLEYVPRPVGVVIFGAGHVSRAIAGLLEPTHLAVTIVDDRPDWNSAERFPHAQRILDFAQGAALASREAGNTLALVMTCSHETDCDVLRLMLKRTPPAFLGLIGSRSKRVCLFGKLIASGIDESLVQRVHCPIGLADTGKEPHAIAISVAAQLLAEARKLAPENRSNPAAAPHTPGAHHNA